MDAQLLVVGTGWAPVWNGKLVPLAEHERWFAEHFGVEPSRHESTFMRKGGDIPGVFIDECHKHAHAGHACMAYPGPVFASAAASCLAWPSSLDFL
ncbi:MAG: hypothetical protein LBC18_07070 [Opitutaceae bacterium]|jgi:hypothetical protein|nr:hypothetical protein [Opitutaceae bacterium]